MAKNRWFKQVLTTVTIALAAIGLLAGCAADSGDSRVAGGDRRSSEEYQHAPGAPDEPGDITQDGAEQRDAEQDGGNSGSGSSVQREPAMVVTTTTEVEVESVDQATNKLESLAHKYQGRIEHRHEELDRKYPSADFTVRIPADQHDAFISEMKALGTTNYLTTEASDVSLQKVDLDARIESLKSSIESLRKMLSGAENVADMLEIERELDGRESELQSLEAQRTELADRISMSTVELRIVQVEADAEAADEEPVFVGALGQGWSDLLAAGAGLVNLLGYALPGLIVCAVLFAALWFGLLRPRYRKARAAQQASESAAAEAMSDQLPPLPELADAHPDAADNTRAHDSVDTHN